MTRAVKVASSVPSYRELVRLLESVIDVLKHERKTAWSRGLVTLESPYPLVAIGDLHGDLVSLKVVLEAAEKEHAATFVFLGDYVDRGPNQVEVLTALMTMKVEHPDKVVLIRGNHEPPSDLIPYPFDFPYTLARLYGDKAEYLLRLAMELFDEMPYAAIADGRAALLHGGIPVARTLSQERASVYDILGTDRWPPDLQLLEEVLWNDPSDDVEWWAPSHRGAGKIWGAKVTEEFLKRTGFSLVVRGHEPADRGYKLNHGGRVITLFSRKGPPYFNEKLGFLVAEDEGCLNPSRVRDCIRTV